jgi:hypothetical protein
MEVKDFRIAERSWEESQAVETRGPSRERGDSMAMMTTLPGWERSFCNHGIRSCEVGIFRRDWVIASWALGSIVILLQRKQRND